MIWKLWHFPEKNDSKNHGTRLESFLKERKGPCKKSESKSRPSTMELSVSPVRTSGTVNRNASNAGWSVSSIPFLLGGQDVWSNWSLPKAEFQEVRAASFWKVPFFFAAFPCSHWSTTVFFLQQPAFSCEAPKTSFAFRPGDTLVKTWPKLPWRKMGTSSHTQHCQVVNTVNGHVSKLKPAKSATCPQQSVQSQTFIGPKMVFW